MKILIIIAWRNIWRHPARSGVLMAAVTVGLWAGVVASGATNGLMAQRISYLIESEVTHAQVHHPQFPAEGHSHLHIPEPEEIAAWLEADARVEAHTFRTIVDGMLRSPRKTAGVRVRGVDTDTEPQTTTFHQNMVAGEYLDSDTRNAVIIGANLAQDHSLQVGNRIVLTFEDIDRELTSGSFNIVGLFESASTDFDQRNVFVRSPDLNRILGEQPVVHEIAILLEDEAMAAALVSELNEKFPDVRAQTWRELSPELNMLVEMGGVWFLIITMIIMTALAFGILNTMLMALFERMHEIGMLLSIGMSRSRMFAMILLESATLTLSGAVIGLALAWLSIRHLGRVGINLEMFAEGVAALGWDYIIYPSLAPSEYAGIVAVVIVVTIAASIYPAVKATRINPLDAVRE